MKTEPDRPSTYDSSRIMVTDKKGSRRIIVWGFLFTLFLSALFVLNPALLQPLDCISYDLLLRNFPYNHVSPRIAIVDLDEKSLNLYGQWPWPRYRVAGLFDKINAMGPSVISIDVVFAEPDRTSAGRMLKDLGAAFELNLAVKGLPDQLRDNDRILAETVAKGPFVLGNKFHFTGPQKKSDPCLLHPVKVSMMQKPGSPAADTGLPESKNVLCNIAMLSEKAAASGFLNVSPDPDGMLRRLPLLIRYNGSVYPSLSLATVLKLSGTNNLLLKKDGNTLRSLNYNGTAVPIDPHGQMLIKFRGPSRRYDYISAADIMDGSISQERLRGRIVFVGTSAAGLEDLLTTPFDPIFPGVEVHATVVDNLLNNDFIAVPGWSNGLVLALILILGVSFSLFIASKNAAACLVVMMMMIAGLWLTGQQVFFRTGLFVGMAFPAASIVCLYIFLSVLKYRMEEKKLIEGMRELVLTQDITIESMANLAECRDPETGGHIKRTRRYVRLLAERLKHHDKYKNFLTSANIEMLYKSAPLHDIGKIGIPDHILLKPGPLTEEEFAVMKTHTTIGRDVIEASVRRLGKQSFLTIAAEMACSHQEKWDGSGYPLGLKGDAIPISGRLMAIADIYDAIISRRVYKPPSPHILALDAIKKGRGTHLDPDMVDTFLEIHEQLRIVARKFADSQEEREALNEDTP